MTCLPMFSTQHLSIDIDSCQLLAHETRAESARSFPLFEVCYEAKQYLDIKMHIRVYDNIIKWVRVRIRVKCIIYDLIVNGYGITVIIIVGDQRRP